MRMITKEVTHTIDEKECLFKITKMDALRASYLLKFVLEKLMPVISKIQTVMGTETKEDDTVEEVATARTNEILQFIPEVLATLSEDDIFGLMRRCLRTVEMKLPAGWQPVIVGDEFGVEELEYDTMTSLILCYEVIDFNTESFFGGKSLTSLLSQLNTQPQKQ